MPRGAQCLPLGRLSPKLIIYYHESLSILICEVSRDGCSVSVKEGLTDELHAFTKQVWAEQLNHVLLFDYDL